MWSQICQNEAHLSITLLKKSTETGKKDFFLNTFFSHFLACHFEFNLLCTPKLWGSNFSSKLQLPKMPGNSNMIIFWLTRVSPFVETYFFFILFSPFYFFLVTWNSAYYAALVRVGFLQKFLENSNIINFGLTNWVPLWGQIFLLFHFFAGHFELSLLCTLKWCVPDFSVNFNYQRFPENSDMINFWLTSSVTS